MEKELKNNVRKLANHTEMSMGQVVEFILDGYFNDSTGAELFKNIAGLPLDDIKKT